MRITMAADVPADGRPDISADSRTDTRADGQWMTLAELALSRRISVPSAARLMRRRHWRRQPGNDGHIRVWVPAGEDEPKTDSRPDDRTDVLAEGRPDILADIRAGVSEVIKPLQDAIAVLEAQLTEANGRAARADSRADILRDKLDALQIELQQAQQAARIATDALKATRHAEETRKGRGRLRRAWDGWRGR
jgi:hypothetical protein